MESNQPIFITGIYRAGTTLISRILNNHSELSVTYDSVHFMRFSYNNFNPIEDSSNISKLVKEIQNRLTKRWNLNLNAEKVINEIESSEKIDYAHVYNIIMSDLLLQNSNAKNWGEKTNVCWGKIPDFINMFPKGKTILIIRDPRDVLISYKNMTTEPGLRYLDSIFASLDSLQSCEKYLQNLSSRNFYMLKYEDLVNDPRNVIEKICNFLEIEFEPVMLDSSKFKNKSGEKWEGNSAFTGTIQGISKETLSRWKGRISKVELFFVEMVLREQMVNFGYNLAAEPLNKKEWDEFFEILNDEFIKERYSKWLKTGNGHENYPSDPIQKVNKEIRLTE